MDTLNGFSSHLAVVVAPHQRHFAINIHCTTTRPKRNISSRRKLNCSKHARVFVRYCHRESVAWCDSTSPLTMFLVHHRTVFVAGAHDAKQRRRTDKTVCGRSEGKKIVCRRIFKARFPSSPTTFGGAACKSAERTWMCRTDGSGWDGRPKKRSRSTLNSASNDAVS